MDKDLGVEDEISPFLLKLVLVSGFRVCVCSFVSLFYHSNETQARTTGALSGTVLLRGVSSHSLSALRCCSRAPASHTKLLFPRPCEPHTKLLFPYRLISGLGRPHTHTHTGWQFLAFHSSPGIFALYQVPSLDPPEVPCSPHHSVPQLKATTAPASLSFQPQTSLADCSSTHWFTLYDKPPKELSFVYLYPSQCNAPRDKDRAS